MRNTRALRDKLEHTQAELRRTREHLEKLRAHQARERQALAQEVEAARREVTERRRHLEALEAQGREPSLPELASLVAAPLAVERSGSAPSALVALVRRPEPLEEALPKLVQLLKLSPVDLRFRLSGLAPAVVARLPLSEAEALRDALRAEGWVAVSSVVPPRAAGDLMAVRGFTLDEEGMDLEGSRGERQRVLYPQLRLLLRGRRTSTGVEAQLDGSYDTYDEELPRGPTDVKREHVEQFLWAYGEGIRAAFSLKTRFSGLAGGQRLSGFESLQQLMEELRQRAPHAVVDDRFLQLPRFTLPLVDADRGQELLGELLYQAIQEGLWT